MIKQAARIDKYISSLGPEKLREFAFKLNTAGGRGSFNYLSSPGYAAGKALLPHEWDEDEFDLPAAHKAVKKFRRAEFGPAQPKTLKDRIMDKAKWKALERHQSEGEALYDAKKIKYKDYYRDYYNVRRGDVPVKPEDHKSAIKEMISMRKDRSKSTWTPKVHTGGTLAEAMGVPPDHPVEVVSGGGKNFFKGIMKGDIKGMTFQHGPDEGIYITPKIPDNRKEHVALSTGGIYTQRSVHHMDQPGVFHGTVPAGKLLAPPDPDSNTAEAFLPHTAMKHVKNIKITDPYLPEGVYKSRY
jgi:hypothetical protein